MKKHTNSEKDVEKKICERLEEATKTLVDRSLDPATDFSWLNAEIQTYTTYLNYLSQKKSLRQIRITSIATVGLAIGTIILALVTWLRP